MKTSELQGAALDWAVAKCEGRDKTYMDHFTSAWHLNKSLRYSSNWAQGGPIIEREIYSFSSDDNSTTKYAWHKDNKTRAYGDTFLIAAMRCFVSSKLGDEVEIPEEGK